MLLANTLGLNRGMLLSFDEHGHVEVEAAHVLHVHAHQEGADHHPHDFPADADHTGLHRAMVDSAEAKLGKIEQPPAATGIPSPLDTVLSQVGSPFRLRPSVTSWGIVEGHFWGSTARVGLACLSATVILV
jgi:hypothetical protein